MSDDRLFYDDLIEDAPKDKFVIPDEIIRANAGVMFRGSFGDFKTIDCEQVIRQIYELMERVLIVPADGGKKYRPVKRTTRNECYKVLWEIQELLGVHKYRLWFRRK